MLINASNQCLAARLKLLRQNVHALHFIDF